MTRLLRTRSRALSGFTFALLATGLLPASAAAQTELVLHAGRAVVHGDWQRVADPAAAGGVRLWNPERGEPKLGSAAAAPADYFDLTFFAEAGRGYRLWIRGHAQSDAWTNDSVFVQFSGSVTATGAPVFRIGTTDATVVSIEEGKGAGLDGWGWQDNGYDAFGPLVYFATTGQQTVRVQAREDGMSIDQIVLSAGVYTSSAPGAAKRDTTILEEENGAPAVSDTTEIVFGTSAPSAIAGAWRVVDDPTAAGGKAVGNRDAGSAKAGAAAASPASYVEYTFNADAGRAYRLWIRGRAEADSWANDSVFVQFSGSVTLSGTPVARIGTSDAYVVNLEEDSGAGVSGWGWQDNGYGHGVLGPLFMFASSGPQTIRIQEREDGLRIDQIVLSADAFLTAAPGPAKNDGTDLLRSAEAPAPPAPAPAPAPQPEPEPEPAPSQPAGAATRLRVVMWNVHHGVGTDGRYDIERIATAMAGMQPEIVMLNEVEKFTGWGNEDQPERFRAMLQVKTGRRWYAHFAQEFGAWTSNGKGHLLLSVYPFDTISRSIITQSSGLNGAGAASQASVTVNGRTLTFILSHLDPYDQAMRLTQAKDVIRWAAGFAENRILGGDMNAWPDQTSIAEFNRTYVDAWDVAAAQGTAVGVPGITPWGATKKGRIDYIFISKNAPNLKVVRTVVHDTRDANGVMPSDHRPVIATIEVR